MSFETVEYSFENNVAVVKMNRPEALNALSLRAVGGSKGGV